MISIPSRPDTLIVANAALPKGVREGSVSKLPHRPDMRLATLCVDLCALTYRSSIRQATAASYEEAKRRVIKQAHIYGFEVELFSTKDQQGAIFYNQDQIFVVFEGSLPDQLSHYDRNLISYLRFKYADAPSAFGGFIHYGFNSALDQPLVHDSQHTLYEQIHERLHAIKARQPNSKLYFSGHSAGGAIAEIMLAREFDRDDSFHIDGLYTYGQPRAGNRVFKDAMDRRIKDRYFRFEQYGDPMPALPPRDLKMVYGEYVHGGQWIPMDSSGRILDVSVDPAFKIEDTLSRKDPSLYERGVSLYNALLGRSIDATRKARAGKGEAAGADADVPVIQQALQEPAPHTERATHEPPDTFSGLMNLLFPKNFYAHSLRSYRNGLLKHIKSHPSPETGAAVPEQQAQHLLWRLLNLEEHLQQAHGALHDWQAQAANPEQHRAAMGAVADTTSTLGRVLSLWDDLRADPVQHLQSGLPPFYYLKVWASTPDRRITNERAEFVTAVQDAARHTRIEMVCDSLHQLSDTLASTHYAGRTHEVIGSLQADISDCLEVADDVMRSVNPQRSQAR